MRSNTFNIGAADLQRKLYPVGGVHSFSIGDGAGDQLATADMVEIVNAQQHRVASMLPRKYRVALERVDGEALSRGAVEGETDFTLGLFPASNLRLWKDMPLRQWPTRRAHMDDYLLEAADYTFDGATGAIVLAEPLEEGDFLFAEYDHTAAPDMLFIRDIVATFSANEIAMAFAFATDDAQYERFDKWVSDAIGHLNQIYKGLRGIPEIDDLDLLQDDTDRPTYRNVLEL